MEFDSYSLSFIGGRSENQDALGQEIRGDSALFVVADGLGGHEQGALASNTAVSSLLAGWVSAPAAEQERLTALIAEANRAILHEQEKRRCDTRTTVAALAVRGGTACWANTGDSRVYFFRGSRLEAVTADHSVAYLKYRTGEITRAQIPYDEDQSHLLRCLGSDTRWEPDVSAPVRLETGDGFLLCTDGLWEYLPDDEILVDYLKADSAQIWGELLLLRVIDRVPPKNDNLSLITVLVR